MPETKKYYHHIDLVKNKLLNFLLHPITTAQRTALAGMLTLVDEGLAVYDVDVDAIYTWDGVAFTTSTIVETDPIYTASSWFSTINNSANWNTAYSWGNHAGLYSLLGHTHVIGDITNFPSQTGNNGKFLTTDGSILSWATVSVYTNEDAQDAIGSILTSEFTYSDGIPQIAINQIDWSKITGAPSFLTVETDPYYTTSSWYTTTNNAANWDTAYSWGNHALAGYLTSYTETDPIYTASSWYTTTNNSGNWDTAYSWGNHALAGYLTSYTETDPVFTAWLAGSPFSGYVPYTGATGDVNLGEHQLLTGQITFDQTPTGTAGVGVMRWNDTDGTVDLGLKGGNVTLQIGQEQLARVVNKTVPLINLLEANYQVVLVTGATGQRLSVRLAQADTDANSAGTLGVVTETINANQEGFITILGQVREIDTTGSLQGETWNEGDVLYLSPTIAGAITNIKPTAPQHSVIIGYVEYKHAVHGKIFVKIDNGYEIGELHDVYAPSPSNKDGIFWNTVNSRYENNSIAGVLGYTPADDSLVVHLAGTETITGDKTFGNIYSNGVVSSPHQLATKEYVDLTVSSGIHVHDPVRVETQGNLTATYADGGTTPTWTDITSNSTLTTGSAHGLITDDVIVFNVSGNGITAGVPYFVYDAPSPTTIRLSLSHAGAVITSLTNGTGLTITSRANSGVGATLTNSGAQAALVIDTISLSVGNRVLVYQQTNAWENGVYEVTTVGSPSTNWVLTRAANEHKYDFKSVTGLGEGDYFFVQEGFNSAGESYVMTTSGTIVFGTTNLVFTQFSAAIDYVGGTNINVSGQTISVSGQIAITNGGTGASDAATARTNLGLAIGTDIPSLTGTGASGTWGISISGNAATVTNGVYTTGSYSDPSWINTLAYSKITGAPTNVSAFTNDAGYLTANQTITLSGDLSGSGSTSISATIANQAVTYAKIQNVTDNRLLGRSAGSAGSVQEITIGSGLSLSAGVLSSTSAGGSVTTVSVVSANGFAGTVANASTTPAITLTTSITGILKGNGTAISAASAGTDYQAPITLTTTGSSGSATFIANTLNIPTYTLAGLGGISLTSLSATTPLSYDNSTGVFSIQVATSGQNGYLSSTDWSTFNSKQNQLNGTGFVKATGTTISYDNSTYLTGNQTITLSGDLSGSGATSISATIANAAVTYAKIQNVAANSFLANVTGSAATVQEISTGRIPLFASAITGTPSGTTYLRGDGTWATVSASLSGTPNYIVKFGPGGSTAVDSAFYDSTGVMVVNTDNTVDKGYIVYDIALEAPRFEFISNGGNNFIKSNGSSYMDVVLNSGTYTHRFFSDGNIGIKTTTNAGYVFDINGTFRTSGVNTLSNLAGSGTRMVVADSTGILSTQAIPGGSSFSWVEVTGTSQSAAVNTGYITNNASLVTVTLPSTAAVGDVVKIAGKGAGGWKIAQNAGQTTYFGSEVLTTGTSGYLQSIKPHNCVELVCITANTDWQVVSSIGNIYYA